jgi:mannosyltransferase
MTETPISSERSPRWLLAVLIAMASAMALRLSSGLGQSFWRDEAATAAASARTLADLFRLFQNAEGGLAGYVVFMKFWSDLAGYGEAALRLPSLAASMVTVVAAGTLASRLAGPAAGLVTGSLLMLHPSLMPFYGIEARPYALATAFVAVAALLAQRVSCEHGEKRWDSVLWAVAATGAVTCHLFAVLPLAPQVLWLRASRFGRKRGFLVKTIALPMAATLVMVALAANVSLLQSWIATVSLAGSLKVARWTVSRSGEILLVASLPGLALLHLARAADRVHSPLRLDVAVAVLWVVGPLLLLTAISILVSPVLILRYVLPSTVGAALLVGLAVSGSLAGARDLRRPVVVRWLAVGALLLGGAVVLAPEVNRDLLQPKKKTEDLRAAAEWLLDHSFPGDRILYAPTWAQAGFEWYLNRLGGGEEPTDLTAAPATSAAAAASLWTPTVEARTARARLRAVDRVWIAGYPGNTSWLPVPERGLPLAAIVRSCWVRVDAQHFGIVLELWKRPGGADGRPGCA